jgi:predicted nucleic acid-binding protein
LRTRRWTRPAGAASGLVEAAQLRNICIPKGSNPSGIDCLIAASAIAGGHELFAVDLEFEAIGRHSTLKLSGDHDVV